ncbi:MAG: 50S ribosomal protein L10 [Pseudomonadota bacterium]
MDRAQKVDAVKELSDIFETSGAVVVANYATMQVAEMSDLRLKMKDAGASFKVAKNRLAKIALDGKPQAVGADLFKGQTGIAFSDDPVAVAKAAKAYAKGNQKFEILGGILGGQVLDAKGVEALADMPSIEEMRAKLLGVFKAPLAKMAGVLEAPPTKMAGVLKAPPQKLLGVLKAYEAKQNEAA